jgi:hypothetical protein
MPLGRSASVAGVAVLVVLLLGAGPAAAAPDPITYVDKIYASTNSERQHTNCWCVVAVAQVALRYFPNSTVLGQTTLDNYSTADRMVFCIGPLHIDALQVGKTLGSQVARDGLLWTLRRRCKLSVAA